MSAQKSETLINECAKYLKPYKVTTVPFQNRPYFRWTFKKPFYVLISDAHGGGEERESFPKQSQDAMMTRATHGGGQKTRCRVWDTAAARATCSMAGAARRAVWRAVARQVARDAVEAVS